MSHIVYEPDPLSSRARDGRVRPVTVKRQGDTVIRRPVGYKRRVADVASDYWIHERRRQAYTLANGQFSTEKIGLHLHADPEVNTNQAIQGGTPGGYGWQRYARGDTPLLGPALRQQVRRDLDEGLRLAAKYEKLAREEYLQRELDGLADAQASIWGKVLNGHIGAVEQFLGISARRCKILGLDEVTVNLNTTLTVEDVAGVKPDVTPEFGAKVVEALKQMGAVAQLEPADDVVDAEVVP